MDTGTSALLTSLVVLGGRLAEGKGFEFRVVIGLIVYAFIITAMANANSKLASQFAVVVLVTAIFLYGVDLFKGLGLIKK